MKAVTALLLLLSFFSLGASKYVDNGNVPFNLAKETVGTITLYVRADGADFHTCLANTAAEACLTVQAAIDKIPKHIKHAVTLYIGAGSFGGFSVTGFTVSDSGGLVIEGALGLATVTTGTASGTATGGSTTTLVDSGQSWTVDDLVGKLIEVNGNVERVIYSNTSNTITYAGVGTSPSGLAYRILDRKSTFTGVAPRMGAANGTIFISGLVMPQGSVPGTLSNPAIELRNVSVASTGLFIGIVIAAGDGIWLQRTSVTGVTAGYTLTEMTGTTVLTDVYSGGNSLAGILMARSPGYGFMNGYYGYNTGSALYMGDKFFLQVVSGGIYARNNATAGIYVYRPGVLIRDLQGVMESNGSGVLSAAIGSSLQINTTTLVGTNTNYGFNLGAEGSVTISSATAVTGGTGDATINGGASILTWATDFASNGDAAINMSTGARIIRKD